MRRHRHPGRGPITGHASCCRCFCFVFVFERMFTIGAGALFWGQNIGALAKLLIEWPSWGVVGGVAEFRKLTRAPDGIHRTTSVLDPSEAYRLAPLPFRFEANEEQLSCSCSSTLAPSGDAIRAAGLRNNHRLARPHSIPFELPAAVASPVGRATPPPSPLPTIPDKSARHVKGGCKQEGPRLGPPDSRHVCCCRASCGGGGGLTRVAPR